MDYNETVNKLKFEILSSLQNLFIFQLQTVWKKVILFQQLRFK